MKHLIDKWRYDESYNGEMCADELEQALSEQKTVRELLFKDMHGCSSHDCIVVKRTGMGTNGSCGCLHKLSRGQIHILKARLSLIIDNPVFLNSIDLPQKGDNSD